MSANIYNLDPLDGAFRPIEKSILRDLILAHTRNSHIGFVLSTSRVGGHIPPHHWIDMCNRFRREHPFVDVDLEEYIYMFHHAFSIAA